MINSIHDLPERYRIPCQMIELIAAADDVCIYRRIGLFNLVRAMIEAQLELDRTQPMLH